MMSNHHQDIFSCCLFSTAPASAASGVSSSAIVELSCAPFAARGVSSSAIVTSVSASASVSAAAFAFATAAVLVAAAGVAAAASATGVSAI